MVEHGNQSFNIGYEGTLQEAEFFTKMFNHALAAHDAELDKTRFVELAQQNTLLNEACVEYMKEIKELKDEAAHARLSLLRIMAAGPGELEHTVRILKKWRDIENYMVETPYLRRQLAEAQQQYADLRMEIKKLL